MNPPASDCGGKGQLDGTTRVVFFDGQRLEADDLNGAFDQLRQLRWLHNRSLHGWGIGLGFDAAGDAGDRQVTVQPGYAVDCLGRELVLTDTATLAVPARSGNNQGKPVAFALVAAYPDDSQLQSLQTRAPDCGGTPGAVRLLERAAIYWREPPVSTGMEIVLATASVQNCQLAQALSVDQTRRARGITTPFLAAGQTGLGATEWQLWQVTLPGAGPLTVGVFADVDTTSGGFAATPTYQAQLRGDRYFTANQQGVEAPFLVDGTLFVADAAPGGFTAYVLLPHPMRVGGLPLNPSGLFGTDPDIQKAFLALLKGQWAVAWVGVEA
jgi:hypothetical protein